MREIYACARATCRGPWRLFGRKTTDVRVGLEYRVGPLYYLLENLRVVLDDAVRDLRSIDPHLIEEIIEKALRTQWPDHAFYIEVGSDDEWVQVFQPWGLPRKVDRDQELRREAVPLE